MLKYYRPVGIRDNGESAFGGSRSRNEREVLVGKQGLAELDEGEGLHRH